MDQPAHELTSRRDRMIFLLTLVAVVVTAALLGYLLGQYAFSRWMGLPPAPAPRLAELGEPPLGVTPPAPSPPAASPPFASPPAVRAPAPSPPEATRPAAPRPEPARPAVPAAPPAAPGPRAQPAASDVQPEAQARNEGYFVQVAAFSQPALAQRALQRLAEQGYHARVVSTRGPDGRELYYKVWVGPYGRREEAIAARERLRAQWPDAWIP